MFSPLVVCRRINSCHNRLRSLLAFFAIAEARGCGFSPVNGSFKGRVMLIQIGVGEPLPEWVNSNTPLPGATIAQWLEALDDVLSVAAALPKRYEAPFKARVALAALRDDKSLSELAAEFSVHSSLISQW